MLRFSGILICLLLSGSALLAQQTWTLEQCVNHATQNSLNIKQAQNQIRGAELTVQAGKMSRLPSLNATTSGGMQFGRTIDPTTNSFDNRQIGFNSYNVSTGVLVSGGNRITNTIRQGNLELAAAKLDAQDATNDLALSVAVAYLNILLSEEQRELARQRRAQSARQLEQTDKLIQAGTLPVNDRLNILSQIALDEQSLIQAENTVTLNYLNLQQLMFLEPTTEFRIARPQISIPTDANPDAFSVAEIYTGALGIQPQILAGDKRMASAEVGVNLAKAAFYPTLSVFGGLTSNYSSVARRIDGYRTITLNQTVFLNGQAVEFQIPQEVPLFSDNPYFDQLNQNFGQNLGVSLSIPIYNNHRNKITVERARLNMITREVANEQLRQQLKTDIQRAVADARAARRSLDAAQLAVNASQAAFDNAQIRYDVGTINSLEYTTARNNLEQAKIDLIRARYQYLFNLKQVDFYMGRKITLE